MTDNYIISYGNLNNFILTTPDGERIPCHNLATARTIKRNRIAEDAAKVEQNKRNNETHKNAEAVRLALLSLDC